MPYCQPCFKNPKKLPDTVKGNYLRSIIQQIGLKIIKIRELTFTPDIKSITGLFNEIDRLICELKTKSAEFGIDAKALDKEYNKIEGLRESFDFIFYYSTNHSERREYLASLKEEEKNDRKNIIINNYEIIHLIDNTLSEIYPKLQDTSQKESIEGLCNHIKSDLLPLLVGVTKRFRREYLSRLDVISKTLYSNQKIVKEHYKNMMISVIELLEESYKAYYANDIDTCREQLEIAGNLMPTPVSDLEQKVYAQYEKLKKLIQSNSTAVGKGCEN